MCLPPAKPMSFGDSSKVVASLGQGGVGCLPETGEPGALAVAERLQSAVAIALGMHAPRLSFGVASLGRHGCKAAALLRAAQRAAATEDRSTRGGWLEPFL
jgi:hypothetical protein